jgi:hypothetical protein
MHFLTFLARLLGSAESSEGVRLEILLLGGRHRGDVLGGAIQELRAPGLDPNRARLLRAVVRHLKTA